jgi:hypothetical protein
MAKHVDTIVVQRYTFLTQSRALLHTGWRPRFKVEAPGGSDHAVPGKFAPLR